MHKEKANTFLLFCGSSQGALAAEIGRLMGKAVSAKSLTLFPDGEMAVEILESVQGRDIFLFHSLGGDPNFYIMELLLTLDALKRAGAASITLLLPYFAYARQDRTVKRGSAIGAKVMANVLSQGSIKALVALDLHSEAIEGFFDIPVYPLSAVSLLAGYIRSQGFTEEGIIVAPDKGAIKLCSLYGKILGLSVALIDKQRITASEVRMESFLGDIQGKTVILADDMSSTGTTLVSAAKICLNRGAKRVIASITHGCFRKETVAFIEESPIEQLLVTNSWPLEELSLPSCKIQVVSIAPLFAQAIQHLSQNQPPLLSQS